jgi:hypothetical protein
MPIRVTAWMLLLCGGVPVSKISAQATAPSIDRGCDTVAVHRRVRADSAALTRKIYEGPVEGSTEGAAIIAYFDARGPRLLLVEYLGETGKVAFQFRIADSANYTVDRVESDYNVPITDSSFTGVARSAEERLLVCGGRPVRRDQGEFFKHASEVLESALEYVSGG